MENIQAKMKELFGNSCYAYCIAAINNKVENRTLKHLTKTVLDYWYRGFIDDDGFVSKPVECMNAHKAFPMYKDVQHVPYVPSSEEQIVCWEYKSGTHFVIMKDNQVVFDPAGESNTVKYGKIKNARKFLK